MRSSSSSLNRSSNFFRLFSFLSFPFLSSPFSPHSPTTAYDHDQHTLHFPSISTHTTIYTISSTHLQSPLHLYLDRTGSQPGLFCRRRHVPQVQTSWILDTRQAETAIAYFLFKEGSGLNTPILLHCKKKKMLPRGRTPHTPFWFNGLTGDRLYLASLQDTSLLLLL